MSVSTNLLQDFFHRYPQALFFMEEYSPWEFSFRTPKACEILRSQWITGHREEHLRERAALAFIEEWQRYLKTPMRPLGTASLVRFPARSRVKEGVGGFDSRLGHSELLESMMRKSVASEMLWVLRIQTSPISGFILEVGGLHKSFEAIAPTRYGNAVGFAGEFFADALPLDYEREGCAEGLVRTLRDHWLFNWLCFGV